MEKYYRQVHKWDVYFKKTKTGIFPAHIHNEIEMKCILQGEHYAHCNGKTYYLKAGDIFISCPNQIHAYEDTPQGCRAYVLIVKPALLEDIGQFLSENTPVHQTLNGEDTKQVIQMLDICYEEFEQNGSQDVFFTLLQGMFKLLIRAMDFHSQPEYGDKSVLKILQYCAEHYKENISLKTLSEGVFLSQSRISHIFSEKLKISFTDYINTLRTADAAKLLTQGGHTISEIAALSGFATIRSFNRAFRNRHGISPKDYRKQKFAP